MKPFVVSLSNHERLHAQRFRVSRSSFDKLRTNGKPFTVRIIQLGSSLHQAILRRDRPPIYLHVPRSHARHWRRHCHEYNACGERVFFVNDNWYHREYVPHYQKHHRDHRDDHHKYRDERRGSQDNRHGNGHNPCVTQIG